MSDDSNTQRTRPSLSLNVVIPTPTPPPPPLDTLPLSPSSLQQQQRDLLPPPALIPPPALKPLLLTSSSISASSSGWSANYNSSPSTNVNYRESLLDATSQLEHTFTSDPSPNALPDPTNQPKIFNDRPQNSISPISITEKSPPFIPWRDGHRRRDSSLSINSEYALSALPSPSVSSMNICGLPSGGLESGAQDWPGPNMYRRRSCEPFAGDETGDSYSRRTGTPESSLSRFSSYGGNCHSVSLAPSISSPSISSGLARADVISGSGRRFSSDDAPSAKTIDTASSHEDPSLVSGTTTLPLASSTDPSFPSTASNAQNVMLLPSVVMPSDIPSERYRLDRDQQTPEIPVSNTASPPTYLHNSSASPPQDFPLMRRSSGSLPSPRPPPALLPMEGLNRRSSERRPPPSSERRQNEAAAQVQAKHVPCLNHEQPHHLATPPSTRNVAFPSRVGPYSILRCLGSGSFSKVYLASREAPFVIPLTSLPVPNVPRSDTSSRPPRSPHQDDLFAIKAIPRASIFEDSRLKASVDRETHLLKYANGHPGVVRFVDALSVATDGSLRGSPRRNEQEDGENSYDWNDSPDRPSPDPASEPCSSLPAEIPATTEIVESRIDGWECLVLEYVQGGELFDWIMRRFTGIPKSKEKKIEAEAEMNRARDEEERREKKREENEEPNSPAIEAEEEVEGRKKRIWDHERDVKQVFRQLLEVVRYLHSRNIVHRDLKLENILITANPIPNTSSTSRSDSEIPNHETPPLVKLTDFGLARRIDPSSPFLTTRCGSEEYAAPEIISGQPYDARLTDAWALGVILYACLTGGLPFVTEAGERRRKYLGRIARGEFKWPQGNVRVWQPDANSSSSRPHDYKISTDAKGVVEGLLTSSARSRWTLDKAWESLWLRESRG